MRELFVNESNTIQAHIRQTDNQLRDYYQENIALRDILKSRNVSFEIELQQRKNNLRAMNPAGDNRGVGPAYSTLPPDHFNNVIASANSQAGLLEMQQPDYMNGNSNAGPSHSPSIHNNKTHATHHNDSPPAIQEAVMIKQEAISDMPGMTGIFEREPQLGVEFILA